MRIGIDARLAGSRHAGIGRYVEELLRHLFQLQSHHQWIVFLREKNQLSWLHEAPNIHLVEADIPHYTIREQLEMPKIFAQEKLDLLHVPHFNVPIGYNGDYVVTIHDLLWHEKKDRNATTLSPIKHFFKYAAYRYVAEQAIHRALAVIVPSQTVADVVKRIVPSATNIEVMKEGIARAYTEKKITGKLTTDVRKPYLVYVGSLYPHKNMTIVLQALQQLPGFHLYIVSARSVFVETIQKEIDARNLASRVSLLGYQNDEQVRLLYQQAAALVFPSLSEGFGLPGLEAMASGTPVIASNIPILQEIYKDAALFFDPTDPLSVVKAIHSVVSPQIRARCIARGYKLASTYSWSDMAKQTVRLYEQFA